MSQQNAATPIGFLLEVEEEFGVNLVFDLACTSEDNVPKRLGRPPAGYFFDKGDNALDQDWLTDIEAHIDADPDSSILNPRRSAAWLNHPFKNTTPWVQKCCQYTSNDGYDPCIFQLAPVGAGTEWFAEHVEGHAAVYFVRPRITFVDPRTGKPFVHKTTGKPQTGLSDTMLIHWGGLPSIQTWKWR